MDNLKLLLKKSSEELTSRRCEEKTSPNKWKNFITIIKI